MNHLRLLDWLFSELFWHKARARNKPCKYISEILLRYGRRQVIHAIGQNQLTWTSQTVGQRSTLHLRAGIGWHDALVVMVTNICSYPMQNAHSSTPKASFKILSHEILKSRVSLSLGATSFSFYRNRVSG